MRSFGVFIAGAAVFTFALLFPMLEPAAEALAAIAFVAAVAYGFAVSTQGCFLRSDNHQDARPGSQLDD